MPWRSNRHAPASGAPLCRSTELALGACMELRWGTDEADFRLLLFRGSTGVVAYVNECPHFSLPLNSQSGQFLLLRGERLMCAWHCAIFGLATGRCIEGPAAGHSLEAVPVTEVDGHIVLSA